MDALYKASYYTCYQIAWTGMQGAGANSYYDLRKHTTKPMKYRKAQIHRVYC